MAKEPPRTDETDTESRTKIAVSDLSGLSKPLCKLIDAIRAGTGMIYLPFHTRRMARAEADAARIKADSDAELAVIKAKADGKAAIILAKEEVKALGIVESAKERFVAKETRRQENIESIVDKAVEQLPGEVSNQQVDEDWTANFFEQCQDVKNEEMQLLWARLLAGEVARPGSYSLRTLDLVKVLRKEEAHLFTRLCSYAWTIANRLSPIIYSENSAFPDTDLNFEHLSFLASIGLIQHGTISGFTMTFSDPRVSLKRLAKYFDQSYLLTLPENQKQFDTGSVLFTDTGRELASIAGSLANEYFRAKTIARWKGKGIEVHEVTDPLPPLSPSVPPGQGYQSFNV